MKTRKHNQRGEMVGGLIWAVAVVVVLAALAQILGYDSIGLFTTAVNWCADKLRDLLGRN